ncbi:uncharacterized protein LOC129747962 [Uranotaenia lowii]|uniref:uncharacterized protein LOC129747962 n=1 Tax=Uranotaenia lowii TaxID=190385 RepID=UPI00247A2560|nr:uncharacterized protein LOC129747962 [Uranotaenia lowii]
MGSGRYLSLLLTVIYIFCCYRTIGGQEADDRTTTLSPAEEYKLAPYCFRFTWIGPKYNNNSFFRNMTCDNLSRKTPGVPCFQPLVVTMNSNVPDTNYMWDTYKAKPTQIACRLVPGEVCARFTFRYNGAIENITYMCAKMNVDNESSTSTACYKEDRSGREIEVCVCESAAGRVPCNLGQKLVGHSVQLLTILVLGQWLLLSLVGEK